MKPAIKRSVHVAEFDTAERCAIAEIANDDSDRDVSIARARVGAGVTTAWHRLCATHERYLIVSGRGYVEIGDNVAGAVEAGDVVHIPAGEAQHIHNTGGTDLVFYAICTPPFTASDYEDLEQLGG